MVYSTLMSTLLARRINPYVIGTPIRDPNAFFGRESLFDFLADNLAQGAEVVVLHGWRRIGKSSVLRQIPHKTGLPDHVFVQFDLQDQARASLPEVLANLAEEIAITLRAEVGATVQPPTAAELEGNPLQFAGNFIPQVLAALGDRRLALLLDEFDVFEEAPPDSAAAKLFPTFKSVLRRESRFQIVAVVGRQPGDLSNLLQIFRNAPHREIGHLDPQSARELIVRPSEGLLTFDEDALRAILDLTAGHPYFAQLVCHELFARARTESRPHVVASDVEAVIPRALESGEAGLAWYWQALPPAEAVFFAACADTSEVAPDPLPHSNGSPSENPHRGPEWSRLERLGVTLDSILKEAEVRLQDWGFLRPATPRAETPAVEGRIAVALVAHWVRHRHPLRMEVHRLEQTSPAADAFYREAQTLVAAGNGGGHPASLPQMCWPSQGGVPALGRKDQQAEVCLQLALDMNPNHFSARETMAHLQLKSQRFDDAVTNFSRLTPLRPDHQDLIAALEAGAQHCISRAAYAKSSRYLEQALALDPDADTELRLRKRLETTRTDLRRQVLAANPFSPGIPVSPERFVGRVEQLDEVLPAIQRGKGVWVSGNPGLGKTSLLRYLVHQIPILHDRARSFPVRGVYLDCNVVPVQSWDDFLIAVHNSLGTDRKISWQQGMRLTHNCQAELEGTVREMLFQRMQHLLVLLDRFDPVLTQSSGRSKESVEEQLCRSLVRLSSDPSFLPISVVLATDEHPDSPRFHHGSSYGPLRTVYQTVHLAGLTDAAVRQLCDQFPSEVGMTDEERNWVITQGGQHPLLLQFALSVLFQARASEPIWTREECLTRLGRQLDPYFSHTWNCLPEAARWLVQNHSSILQPESGDTRRPLGEKLHQGASALEAFGLLSPLPAESGSVRLSIPASFRAWAKGQPTVGTHHRLRFRPDGSRPTASGRHAR